MRNAIVVLYLLVCVANVAGQGKKDPMTELQG